MPNLTIEQGIVKNKDEDISTERGFDLVIQEDLKYRVILEDQPIEKKGWFSFKKKKIEVFAVSNDNKHRLDFKRTIPHTDGIHSFYLDFSIGFSVSDTTEDKIILIKKLKKDPVDKLKSEVGRVIGSYLKKVDWKVLSNPHQFEEIKTRALEDFVTIGREEIQIYDRLLQYANEFGLLIHEIGFDITIPETHLVGRIKEEEFTIEGKIKVLEIEKELKVDNKGQELRVQKKYNDNELRDIERKEKVKDNFYNTIGNYIDQVGGNIAKDSRTTEDALRDFQGMMQLNEVIGSKDGSPNTIGTNNNFTNNLLGSGNDKNLFTSFHEVVVEIKRANLGIDIQMKTMAALFHLSGLMLVKEEENLTQRYLSRLEEVDLPKDLREFIQLKWTDISNHVENRKIL